MATILSYALSDLASVKESLSIASSDTTKDNLIIRKINQATTQIENYCSRRFAATSYTQVEYNATQVDQLILNQRPITTFTSLEIRDSGLNYDSWETIDSKLYFVDTSAGVIDLMFNASGRWMRYRVTYVAGYSTIPSDLSEACATLAAYYVLNPDGKDVGVQEFREGQRMVRYANASLKFKTIIENLGIDEIINGYSNLPIMTDR